MEVLPEFVINYQAIITLALINNINNRNVD